MKNITSIIIVTIILFQFGCTATTKKADEVNSYSLDWIIGNWERTNDDPEQKTFENWSKINDHEYVGEGFTLADKDTVFKEELRIIFIDNNWQLEVTGVNDQPTIFKYTNQSDNSFTCENKLNEFPKIISYSFNGNKLTAVISDDNDEIVFSFEKN